MASSSLTTALELSAPKVPIPTCSPNLMPFHIKYSGPAPVSTYFRVKQSPSIDESSKGSNDASSVSLTDARPSVDGTSTSDSQATLVSAASASSSSGSVATLASGVSSSNLDEKELGRHLVAAFRGRTVRGTEVALPEGFTGVVLSRSDGQSSSTAPVKTQRNTRARRGTSKRQAAAVEGVDEEDVDMGDAAEATAGPVRTLQATGTFASFNLWNPDIPVDGGRDEYLRSLTEWTKIAAEIHHCED